MKKIIFIILIFMNITTVCYAKEPKNLDIVKQEAIKYHDSGEYQKDQAKVVDQAMLYLKKRLESEKQKPSNKKFAIVLDIDETSLSNYPDMVKLNFGGTEEDIERAEGNGTDPVIAPTLELYRYAQENKIAVFFITGRTENYRKPTAANLIQAGYSNWNGLILKPVNYHQPSAATYKTAAREEIEKMGYDIILNMGDQKSDLTGKHADKTFKLPNPYYLVP